MTALRLWLANVISTRDPIVLTFGMLRIVVVALGTYLVVVSAVGLAARVLRWPRLIRSVDIVTVPSLRRCLDVIVGTSMAVGVLTPTWAAATPDPQPPPVMVVLPDQPEALAQPSPPTVATTAAETWTIQPGQNLWFVAEETLRQSGGHSPSVSEIVPYWRQLIDANRDRFRDPANPSLVYPGQVIELPAR